MRKIRDLTKDVLSSDVGDDFSISDNKRIQRRPHSGIQRSRQRDTTCNDAYCDNGVKRRGWSDALTEIIKFESPQKRNTNRALIRFENVLYLL